MLLALFRDGLRRCSGVSVREGGAVVFGLRSSVSRSARPLPTGCSRLVATYLRRRLHHDLRHRTRNLADRRGT
jgi:hypothetical protein